MNSEDTESEIEGVWEEVEAACSSIPSLDEPRLHHLAHTLFVVRRYFCRDEVIRIEAKTEYMQNALGYNIV